MENRLKTLFDYQKFEQNPNLEQVISGTHGRYAISVSDSSVRELTLDEMEWLAAAGSPNVEKEKK